MKLILIPLLVISMVITSTGQRLDANNTGVAEVVWHEVISEFPNGMRFKVNVESDSVVEEIALRMRVGQQNTGVYEYFDIEPSQTVSAELFWNTYSASKYIPPGTVISYSFEVSTADGLKHASETYEFVFQDVRFKWDEISEGPVTVAYHGPVKSRAVGILDAMLKTMAFMEIVLGEGKTDPIRVNMYNNTKEMLVALPPGSATIRRELITEGQAFTKVGTLLVLGGGRLATGTASHEVTHILVHRAGDSVFGRVPSWLDEGLAEFGNVSPTVSYEVALDFGVHAGKLLPITSMPSMPGDPEDVIMFYGQARSIVEYMIIQHGPAKMRELLAVLKSGKKIDDAIISVYGMDRISLENQWRSYIGAPKYDPVSIESVLPTPLPRPTVTAFTLTPQVGGQTVASFDERQSVKENGNEMQSSSSGFCNRTNGDRGFDVTNVGFLGLLLFMSARKIKHLKNIL